MRLALELISCAQSEHGRLLSAVCHARPASRKTTSSPCKHRWLDLYDRVRITLYKLEVATSRSAAVAKAGWWPPDRVPVDSGLLTRDSEKILSQRSVSLKLYKGLPRLDPCNAPISGVKTHVEVGNHAHFAIARSVEPLESSNTLQKHQDGCGINAHDSARVEALRNQNVKENKEEELHRSRQAIKARVAEHRHLLLEVQQQAQVQVGAANGALQIQCQSNRPRSGIDAYGLQQKDNVLHTKQRAKDYSAETAQRNQRILQEHKQQIAARKEPSTASPSLNASPGKKPQVTLHLVWLLCHDVQASNFGKHVPHAAALNNNMRWCNRSMLMLVASNAYRQCDDHLHGRPAAANNMNDL